MMMGGKVSREGEMTSARPRFMRKGTYAGLKVPILVALVGLGILTAVGLVWFGWWDIAQNRRILASLPLPPEAERTYIGSQGYSGDDSIISPPEYWSTRARFEIPGYSREYLVDFYISRLSAEWDYCMKRVGHGMRFVKDGYKVSLSTSGASSPTRGGSFDIHISPDGGRNPCQ